MPKVAMNYQKSVIYKIVSNNPDILDCYVGSTTNFNKRKASHKALHNNPNSTKYNFPIYKYIRDNGGWDNFDMILIENYPCDNQNELHARERHFIENLKANLNRVIPTRTPKEYREGHREEKKEINKKYQEYRDDSIIECECGTQFRKSNKVRHNKSNKHQEFLNCHSENDC